MALLETDARTAGTDDEGKRSLNASPSYSGGNLKAQPGGAQVGQRSNLGMSRHGPGREPP